MTHTTPSSTLRTTLATILALTLLTPLAAIAQMGGPAPLGGVGAGAQRSQPALYDEDLGANSLAKLEATYEEEQVCLTLALALVPRGLRTGNFNVVRTLHVDDSKRNYNLKLKFPKKAEAENESIGVWRACAEAQPRMITAERDTLKITVRQFDQDCVPPTESYDMELSTGRGTPTTTC